MLLTRQLRTLVLAMVATSVTSAALAQSDASPEEVLLNLIGDGASSYLTQSEQNLMMMADSPAMWTVEDGEALFYEQRGPNNVSLEECDLGKGPGVVDGAYVELPRYFEDADRVMDLEARLIYCMETIQGIAPDADDIQQRHGSSTVLMQLQTFIANRSNGYEWNSAMNHPMERALRDAGEVMFNRRAGSMDFACSTCHSQTGKRIRASVLPNVSEPTEWTKAISWPSFRVGQDNVRSSLHRVRGCYWQMRQGQIEPGSDAALAIITYWTDAARGQPAILPDMKR